MKKFIAFILILCAATGAGAADMYLHVPLYLQSATDSVQLLVYSNENLVPANRDSLVHAGNVQIWDTSITIGDDSGWTANYRIWYTGNDSAVSFTYNYIPQAAAAASTDTTNIKLMLLNNLFARLSQDTSLLVSVEGAPIINIDSLLGDLATAQFEGSFLTSALVDGGTWQEAAPFIMASLGDSLYGSAALDDTIRAAVGDGPQGGYIDSNITEQGGIAGATIPFYVYTIDTSGTDDTVSITSTGLEDATGSPKDGGPTNSAGFIQFTVTSGTWTVSATQSGYHFDDSSYSVTTNDTVAIWGYDRAVSTPSSADLSTVFGYIKDASDNPLIGCVVSATLSNATNTGDTSGTSVIVGGTTVSADADTLGYFELFLRRTTTFTDTTRGYYNIVGTYNEEVVFNVTNFYVPASGNVNLGDTLLVRQ